MKTVILAGGLGTRLSEETHLRPKPMVEIGGQPILWHIMRMYLAYGFDDFIICGGYKAYVIKEYFANYSLHTSDVTFDLKNNKTTIHRRRSEPWKVTIIDTGEETMTGGRLKRVRDYLNPKEPFFFTYGDGVSDVPIDKLLDFHLEHGRKATVTAVRPPGRYGSLEMVGKEVFGFSEKPDGDGSWINGGFFVLQPEVIDLIAGDASIWEREPLETLARQKDLLAFQHEGFWQPMDTLREKNQLEEMWISGSAPWQVWD